MDESKQYDKSGRAVLKQIRYRGLRKIVGTAMSESLKKSPQATITMRVDISAIQKIKEDFKAKGEKITYTDIYIKAVSCALLKHPAVNSSLQDEKYLVQYANTNIGVAVGTDQGLYVPVIKDVQDKTIPEISRELKEIVANLRSGNGQPDYCTGGTFTISNLGMYDIDVMTPIVSFPEAAILCLGVVRKEYVILEDDTAVVRPMMTLSFTLDHAALDGLDGAQFLLTLREILSEPEKFFPTN